MRDRAERYRRIERRVEVEGDIGRPARDRGSREAEVDAVCCEVLPGLSDQTEIIGLSGS